MNELEALIMADRELAVKGENIFRIDPLK